MRYSWWTERWTTTRVVRAELQLRSSERFDLCAVHRDQRDERFGSGVILGTDFVDGFDIDNLAAQADPYNAVDLAADSDAFTIAGICWSTSIVITDCGTTGGGTSGTPAAPGTDVKGITGTGPYNTTDMEEFAPGTDVYVVVAVNVAGDLELSDFTNVALTAGVLMTNGTEARLPAIRTAMTRQASVLLQTTRMTRSWSRTCSRTRTSRLQMQAGAVERPGYNFFALGGDNDVDLTVSTRPTA